MTTSLCIFEDKQYASLLPLTALRPVWDIRCGIFTLGEKIERAYARSNDPPELPDLPRTARTGGTPEPSGERAAGRLRACS